MDFAKVFDRVYCINLDRRPDRWKRFEEGVPADWPFAPIERLAAVDGERVPPPTWWHCGTGAWGCFRTHFAIIERALAEGIDSILIFEDDALFPPDFSQRVIRFFEHVPANWGMLYLGGQHLKFDAVPPRRVNDEVCVPYNVNRTHAFALRGETMRAVYRHLARLDWWKGNHIDHHLGRFVERRESSYPVYCPREWLVGQAGGDSDIARRAFPDRFWNEAEGDDAPVDRPFYVVLGPHSSGTSALAGVCWSLGVDFGDRLGGYYGNMPGGSCGYEDETLAEICETLLPFPLTERTNDRELILRLRHWIARRGHSAEENRAAGGAKYPLLCRLGDVLQEACGDRLRLIVADRNLNDSVRSLQNRFPNEDPSAIERHQVWLRDGLDELRNAVPEASQLSVSYDRMLERPAEEGRRIAEFLGVDRRDLACHVARAVAPIRLYRIRQTQPPRER